jgi:hypothetical protein
MGGGDVERTFTGMDVLGPEMLDTSVRFQRVDGSSFDGQIVGISPAELYVLDEASEKYVHVFPHELESIEVSVPRRVREWALAILAVPAVTATLVAYSRLPWVRPKGGDVLIGFAILGGIGWGIVSIPRIHRMLASWLTRRRRIYPPAAPRG